ncbi:MAG TPA: hypothetical protein D7I06_03075 [Candidatus Poseidoniales archaeon]|nr:MAG TPA: hypothetical protein D7I06_03075 [Candidatus Poseidoniales archaeon]
MSQASAKSLGQMLWNEQRPVISIPAHLGSGAKNYTNHDLVFSRDILLAATAWPAVYCSWARLENVSFAYAVSTVVCSLVVA